jgi:hypothetical protein
VTIFIKNGGPLRIFFNFFVANFHHLWFFEKEYYFTNSLFIVVKKIINLKKWPKIFTILPTTWKSGLYYLGFFHFQIWISLNLAKFIMDDCHLSNITIFF